MSEEEEKKKNKFVTITLLLPYLLAYLLRCALAPLARHHGILLPQVPTMTIIGLIVRTMKGNISGGKPFGDKAWKRRRPKKQSNTIIPVEINHWSMI
jgi:hypothetical protein